MVGRNRPLHEEDDSRELRLFRIDKRGSAQAVPAPFDRVSDDHQARVLRLGRAWCVTAVSPEQSFMGACRRGNAPWATLPTPPHRGDAAYDVAAVGDALYVVVASSTPQGRRARPYRLVGRTWRAAGPAFSYRGGTAEASALGGHLVVTILQPLNPQLRLLRLEPEGRWRTVRPRAVLRRLGRVGHSALLGVPRRWGHDLLLGLSIRVTAGPEAQGLDAPPLRSRFGVASLRDGRFAFAPLAPNGQAQGQVLVHDGRAAVAWKEFLVDHQSATFDAVLRVAELPKDRRRWKQSLTQARVLARGPWLFGPNVTAISQGAHRYLLHPVLEGEDRVVYTMTRLHKNKRRGERG